jgi:hypothetical protein
MSRHPSLTPFQWRWTAWGWKPWKLYPSIKNEHIHTITTTYSCTSLPIFPCKVHDIDGLLYHECCAKGCSLGIAAWVLHQFTWSPAVTEKLCLVLLACLCKGYRRGHHACSHRAGFDVGASAAEYPRLRSQAFKSGGWYSYHGRAVKTVEWILNMHFGIKTVTLWAVFFQWWFIATFLLWKRGSHQYKGKTSLKRVKSLQSTQTLNVMTRRLFPRIMNSPP